MKPILALLSGLALALSACIEVQRTIEITPGTVAPAIRGAKWSDLPIDYCIVRDDEAGFTEHETLVELTQQAIALWGVPAAYQGECANGIEEGNGINEVGWGDLEVRSDDLTEAGTTKLRYRSGLAGEPPRIVEADITIERDPEDKATRECLYTTLLHEAGHLFGLPHLDISTVMAPVITDCLQELTAADRAALDEIY